MNANSLFQKGKRSVCSFFSVKFLFVCMTFCAPLWTSAQIIIVGPVDLPVLIEPADEFGEWILIVPESYEPDSPDISFTSPIQVHLDKIPTQVGNIITEECLPNTSTGNPKKRNIPVWPRFVCSGYLDKLAA